LHGIARGGGNGFLVALLAIEVFGGGELLAPLWSETGRHIFQRRHCEQCERRFALRRVRPAFCDPMPKMAFSILVFEDE